MGEIVKIFNSCNWNERVDLIEPLEEKFPTNCLYLQGLSKNISEGGFKGKILQVYGNIVYDTLFGRFFPIGSLINYGFLVFVKSTKNSPTLTQLEKKNILQCTLKDVLVKAMIAFFNIKQGITNDEPLALVKYNDDIPSNLRHFLRWCKKIFSNGDVQVISICDRWEVQCSLYL